MQSLEPGKRVYWTDPDGGICSRVLTIGSIRFQGDMFTVEEQDGSVVEGLLPELSIFCPGDTIRLYGYPGVFTVCEPTKPIVPASFPQIGVARDGKHLWNSNERVVVEHNGQPLPLRSCPIVAPAYDYPHKPEFDYTDGPKARGLEALSCWLRMREVPNPVVTLPQGK